jgi:TolB protein
MMKLLFGLALLGLGIFALAYAYKKEPQSKVGIILSTVLGVLSLVVALFVFMPTTNLFSQAIIEPTAALPSATSDPAGSATFEYHFLFSSNQSTSRELYLYSTTAGQTRLTHNTVSDDYPSWSPDGALIAFTTHRDGNNEIYVMQSNGHEPINITNHPEADFWPAWSPDGKHIAFVSNRNGNHDIYVMGADGMYPTQLTSDMAQDLYPSWSPDSQTILFSSNRDGNFEIYSMSPTGQNQTRLTGREKDDLLPEYSPDGQQIIFDSNIDGDRELFVMNKDGSNVTQITTNFYDEGDACFLSNTQILFTSMLSGNWNIYLMDLEDKNLTPITNNSEKNWSPEC